MAVLKCKMCGGDLNLIEGASTAECEYCGSVQTIPKVDDEKKLTLFARANRLRAACEFDKAAGIYEAIVADFPEEAEAYWGLVLCTYGIEYVDDPATGKKVSTCHRSGFDSVMKDPNVELAQEYADVMARKLYREEAKAIEELRKSIIAVSANEQPYDLFICYKETDFNGKRTLDSVLAQDIYDALTDKGYRVFFSRISLEDKLGVEYEPYIFAALNSAKIMLVVGTDYEYFNAVWVKNEWSRFLKLMAKDKSKHLIPCYKGIDAYDMPEEFARLQAQDLDKMGAVQDIVRGVQKLLPKQEQIVKETVVVQQAAGSNPTVESYLKRVFMFLQDGDWKSADEYCEKVLDIDPECAEAYLGKLMAEMKVKERAVLQEQAQPFDDRNYFVKAIRFADTQLAAELNGYVTHIRTRLDGERIAREQRKEKTRKRLRSVRERIQTSQRFLSASTHTVGLQSDGTVVTTNASDFEDYNMSDWDDIVAVAAGCYTIFGLKSDGTVVFAGVNEDGECDVAGWTDIVAIAASDVHTVGLKSDGTVVAVGDNWDGQCDVAGWTDIVAVAADSGYTVGLKSDGTVVVAGHDCHKFHVAGWRDIVAISGGTVDPVGLKADGTVVHDGLYDVTGWRDIVAISANSHIVGLKVDGTVVAVGDNENGECDVAAWTDIVAIAAGFKYTVGLKSDGTVVVAGKNESGECDVADWRLFGRSGAIEPVQIESAFAREKSEVARIARAKREEEERIARAKREEEERIAREKREEEERIARAKREEEERIAREKREEEARIRAEEQRARRQAGLCQHCGGELKGIFGKKCVNCGKSKDY